ncbi:PEP-CTERM sorting domain-containing protein [Crocosphaera sp. UHCC 0190]|uniref:PEP-CTERM sorting domain-containing protein n=1 Tax=Crocosphaera sp. UHCC 0190 TaxID=3110246 RepID=UPI002B1EA4FB|nr:PEP-CTERM sorting domain-containing protein [Crocosphaera sp. UHCC 0190]MEA5509642.1 PEP-CTERM sorting domain-containing protein [Crocosphaera sp. UHCC 0190]
MRKNTLTTLLPIIGLAGSIMLSEGVTPSPVHAISFNINWTGGGGYTMTGMFSYDDVLIGTGAITGSSLDSFMIEFFQNSTSLGTWQPSDGGSFNFNFDTTTETFVLGGNTNTTTGQDWGLSSSGFGFGSGVVQALFQNGSPIPASATFVTNDSLTSSQVIEMPSTPEPVTVFGFLVVGAGLLASKNNKQT